MRIKSRNEKKTKAMDGASSFGDAEFFVTPQKSGPIL